MVSLKHRAMEWLVKGNPGELLVRDLEELRTLRVKRQDEAGEAPPPGLAARVDLSSYEHEGMAVHVLAPRSGPTERTIFYLHGGGYVGHADPQHWRYAERLTEHLSATVVMPAYPLAPRSTWREAHPLVAGLFRRVTAETIGDLTLLGDSAGGGFALALAQQMVAESGPLPARLVLCGTKDFQLPQARALVATAQAAGTPVTYVEENGLLHDYPVLNIPEARRALRQVGQFVRGEPVKVSR